jgi:hypothetical protein
VTQPADKPKRDRVAHFFDEEIGRFSVRIASGTKYVAVGSFRVPEAFSIEPLRVSEFPDEVVRELLPIIDVRVEDGQPVCVAIRRPPSGPPLTTESLRIPLADYMRAATYAVARERRGGPGRAWTPALGRGAREEFEEAAQPRSRGGRVDDDFLREVAGVYREALLLRQPPTQAVAQAFGGKGGTPGRWVQEARRRGFLGRAKGTKAGER